MAGELEEKDEEIVVVVEVTVEEEETPCRKEETLEAPRLATLGTIVVTNRSTVTETKDFTLTGNLRIFDIMI